MIGRGPPRSLQSYRHEAFFWHGRSDFVGALVPFIQDGLAADEAVLVVVLPEHAEWICGALDGQSRKVHFVDMEDLGHNPARIIPRLQQFLNEWSGTERPARAIGEPIWPGRRPEELLEGQLHEALLNIAIEPRTPFWTICPYDAGSLDPAVLEEAHRSHPAIIEAGIYRGSPCYSGLLHAESIFSADLPTAQPPSRVIDFSCHTMSRLDTYVKLELYVAGLTIEMATSLAGVLVSLGLESLARGASEGTITIWSSAGALICEVADDTVVGDVLLGRRASAGDEPDAFRPAQELGDLVQVRSSKNGTRVRIHTWL